jgi:hypothetical protein
MYGVGQCGILAEPIPIRQQYRPVVLSTTYKRELLCSGIPNVYGDVPAVLTHPPERNRRTVPITCTPQRNHECRGQYQLEQRPAQKHQGLATKPEDQMPSLMYCEIEAIDPAILARISETDETVDQENKSERGTPALVIWRTAARGIFDSSPD